MRGAGTVADDGLKSMKVSGRGVVAGGHYDVVKGSGSVRIDGDLVARSVDISGSVTTDGGLRSARVKISGKAAVNGDVDVLEGRASGSFRIGRSLNVKNEAQFSGALTVGGDLTGTRIHGSGSLRVGGEIALDRLEWSGSVNCPGLVSADAVDIRLSGSSVVGELAGSVIQIGTSPSSESWWAWINLSRKRKMSAGEISGDDIKLEYTDARLVRGDRVIIGRECRIQRVEYRQSLDIHEDSSVGERTKVGDPD